MDKKKISNLGVSLSSLKQNHSSDQNLDNMDKKRKGGLSEMGVSLSRLMRNVSRDQILRYALMRLNGNAAFFKTLSKQDSENN